jgi:ArsR family transcriptional regulator
VDVGLRLGSLCKAMGHPARVTIVRFLQGQRGGASCSEIVRQLPLSQSTVSQHLRVLKHAGFLVIDGIPPRVVYRVDHRALDTFKRAVASL